MTGGYKQTGRGKWGKFKQSCTNCTQTGLICEAPRTCQQIGFGINLHNPDYLQTSSIEFQTIDNLKLAKIVENTLKSDNILQWTGKTRDRNIKKVSNFFGSKKKTEKPTKLVAKKNPVDSRFQWTKKTRSKYWKKPQFTEDSRSKYWKETSQTFCGRRRKPEKQAIKLESTTEIR